MEIKYTKGFLNDMERLFSSSWRYSIPRFFRDIRFRIKEAYLRAVRGYDDESVWDHYHWAARTNAQILRDLAKNKVGCPSEFFNKKNKKDECFKWKKTLIEMAEGFEAALSIGNLDYMDLEKGGTEAHWRKKEKQLKDKFDKGMNLYHKYFYNLWD